VENYKSIDKIDITIRPITVLAGANSTGKSSVMQPLLLMKQTLETRQPSLLSLEGKNVNVISFDCISSKVPGASPDAFSVQIESGAFQAKSIFKNANGGVDLSATTFNFYNSQTNITLNENTNTDELRGWMCQVYRGLETLAPQGSQFVPSKDKCFYSVHLANQSDRLERIAEMSPLFRPSDIFTKDISGIIHLPRWRGTLENNVSLSPPLYPGTFQDYSPYLIEIWEKQDRAKFSLLVEYLNTLHLSTGVSTNHKGESLEIVLGWHQSVPPKDKNDMVSIANVGVGVSQALPILVALIAAEPDQIVYIEQPGIHLHPSAHVGLVEAIIDAANRGVRVVVETHSATFLLALQTLIAEQNTKEFSKQRLDLENIALYWFSRRDNGASQVDGGKLEKDGTYGNWPVDFSSVTGRLNRRYLETMKDEVST